MKIENPFLSEAELVAKIDQRRPCEKALAISLPPPFKRENHFFFQLRRRNLLGFS